MRHQMRRQTNLNLEVLEAPTWPDLDQCVHFDNQSSFPSMQSVCSRTPVCDELERAMFTIPDELPARILFLGFAGFLGIVLLVLAIVCAEVLWEASHKKTRNGQG
jgi:hypothetical protein